MSDATGGQGVPPEPASGDAAQGRTLDTPGRSPDPQIHPRWATTTWWRVVSAVEITVLAVLGYMAKGDRYPLVEPPAYGSYLMPVTRSEIVGAVIIFCVFSFWGLLILTGRPWSKLVLAVGLAVAVAVAVFLFEWGTEERLSMSSLPVPSPAWQQALDTCREQYPTAAEEAYARWRVPDECRDIWLNAAVTATTTTTTTDPLMEAFLEMRADKGGTTATTLPTVDAARAALNASLDAEARAALKALDDSHGAIARTLDKNDQATLIVLAASLSSENQSFKDNAREAARDTLDSLDWAAFQLVEDTEIRLGDLLSADAAASIDRYLSIVSPRRSDLDTFLDVMGFGLNTAEVDAPTRSPELTGNFQEQ